MNWRISVGAPLLTLHLLCVGVHAAEEPLPETIQFNRHVRPILSDKCYACHGPDDKARKADLRFDLPLDISTAPVAGSAIVPGNPDASELVRRILTTDAEDQMPPADQKKQLSTRDKAMLQAWIAQGAEYEPHWAYLPPTNPEAPDVGVPTASPIDAFIQRELNRQGLTAQASADRRTLIRRLYWDLLGFPPTPDAALWRTDGDGVVGRGSLCRFQRLPQ